MDNLSILPCPWRRTFPSAFLSTGSAAHLGIQEGQGQKPEDGWPYSDEQEEGEGLWPEARHVDRGKDAGRHAHQSLQYTCSHDAPTVGAICGI